MALAVYEMQNPAKHSRCPRRVGVAIRAMAAATDRRHRCGEATLPRAQGPRAELTTQI
ncbi:MAG: hypothetical protein RL385_1437 [Pseudomonadota bacterium]|jgi:hypothetical protein